jgi:hypothetical protein
VKKLLIIISVLTGSLLLGGCSAGDPWSETVYVNEIGGNTGPVQDMYVENINGEPYASRATVSIENKDIYVDKEAAGEADGTSWGDAFATIQDAVDSIPDILVHEYTMTAMWLINYILQALFQTVRSGQPAPSLT